MGRPSVVVRLSGQPSRKKVRAKRPLTDDSCSFGGGDHFAHGLFSPSRCFVPVLRVFALLERGLTPRRFGRFDLLLTYS